jgi:phage shock protein A
VAVGEPLFLRMKRVISANVEGAVGKAESLSASSLMRHSIREVEGMIGRARTDREAAVTRAEQAADEQKIVRAQIQELGAQARFAVEKGRTDLAEATLSRQIDLESQVARLDRIRADSAREVAELEADVGRLAVRKAEMERDYAAFEEARREADLIKDDGSSSRQKVERRLERARAAFDRAMEAGDGPTGGIARQVAEIEALKRESLVAERLAAIRDGKQASGPKKRANR